MKKEVVKVLSSRSCQGSCQTDPQEVDFEEIKSGNLIRAECGEKRPIVNFVPTFLELNNYTDSFAFQRKEHARIHMDKFTGTDNQRRTILERTGRDTEFWVGKPLLECGCGDESDTQVHLDLGTSVLSVDLSTRIDECKKNNYPHASLNIIQSDISSLPLKSQAFDIVYCQRVIQQTPDPRKHSWK